jgi:hypothetical protein
MRKLIDLTGQVFYSWTVIGRAPTIKNGHVMWLCRCVCGTEKHVEGNRLKDQNSKSCGCVYRAIRAARLPDLTGKVFGRWTVIRQAEKQGTTRMWLCRCECGVEKAVKGFSLTYGESRSCGCLKREQQSSRRGPKSSQWKGGRQKNINGYALIHAPNHPNTKKSGYILEHVYIMSEILGRPLTKDETVHHRNGIRDDNKPENLELWTSRHPGGQRISDLLVWAKEILEKYEPIINK